MKFSHLNRPSTFYIPNPDIAKNIIYQIQITSWQNLSKIPKLKMNFLFTKNLPWKKTLFNEIIITRLRIG